LALEELTTKMGEPRLLARANAAFAKVAQAI
jgi:hypothetical protein